MRSVDFIIVGSGSAGSALAARLGDANIGDILVIEYGGSDFGPLIQMPAALSYPMNMKRYDWGYQSQPEKHLGGRRLACPRGKVLGGSSSINGMVWVRGHPMDFDHWQTMGASHWGWENVAPYYDRLENAHGGQVGWRGDDGPMHITRGRRQNPLYHAFVDAGRQAGYQITDDYNGEKQEGFGAMEQSVWQGRRWSVANAYLKPALANKKVQLLRAFVRRVIIKQGRAIGVEIEKNDKIEIITAKREVILSASAINSPKLLMLSGIGDRKHLQKHNITVIADRPGVGANLQDHLELYIQMRCKQAITLYSKMNLLGKAGIGLKWLLNKSGDGATNHFESAAFIRSQAGVQYPDIQFHFLPIAIRYDGKSPVKAHGFQAHVGHMRSPSRGHVKLTSANPLSAPEIVFNYMSCEADWQNFRTCIRLSREIFTQKAFMPYAGSEIAPGAHCQSDEALDDYLKDALESAYHPCGTCTIGQADNPMAVVDPTLKVIGVKALRVVDSSVFPRITNGNLNAPSIMVGEKGADHILGRKLLKQTKQKYWVHPNWQQKQR